MVWRWGVEMGLWMFLGFAFQAIGLEYTTAQRSGFLLYLNVKFVPFLAFLLLGRHISAATWASALAAVAGSIMSVAALGYAMACYDEALDWARQRKTFGHALVQHQVIRHKLADMQMRIGSTQAWVDALSDRADAGEAVAGGDITAHWVAQVCLLKNHATQTMQFCADQAVQILGGMGFMRGTRSERIYREVKVMMIGGGSEEIMKELATRQLGL